MKTFIAVLLLTACVAYAVAEEAFHEAVFQFLDERHDERMAQVLRDNGLPEDTLPATQDDDDYNKNRPRYWIVLRPLFPIRPIFKRLIHRSSQSLAPIQEYDEGKKQSEIESDNRLHFGPKGCVALLYLCRKHSPTCAGELCCFVRIKRCFQAVKGG
ncbi:unnamed protein product [Porites evermanni]|uniref:Uncharacterized protein n=1 Tax=Porites evermanni TaxID=104178 RepID=A0ABN8NDU4_9CNID|nr:unnamed protein product [Porites evermanni]